MNRVIAGLDIGTSNVRVVIAEVDADGNVQVVGFAQQKSQGIRKGAIVNIDSLVSVIQSTVEQAELSCGVQITQLYTIIGGSQVEGFNSKGQVGVSPRGENKPTPINAEARKRAIEAATAVNIAPDRFLLHVIPQEYIVDGNSEFKKNELIGTLGVRLEVSCHLVTISRTALSKIEKSILQAGYEFRSEDNRSRLMLKSLAAANATIHEEENELGSILIDLGAGSTDVIVMNKGSPVYSTSIPVGQEAVTNDLAVVKGIPFETAEKIKLENGGVWQPDNGEDTVIIPPVGGKPPEEITKKELCLILMARMEEIMTMVKKQVVQNAKLKKINGSIVLTGGGALMPGVIELTQYVWQTSSVRLGMGPDYGGDNDRYREPDFATVMGIIAHNKDYLQPAKTSRRSRGLEPSDKVLEKGSAKNAFKNFLNKIF